MGWQRSHDPCRSNVPQEDGFIVRTAHQHIAFGRECDGVDVVMVAKQRNRIWLALSTINFSARILHRRLLTVATSHSLIDLSSEPDASVFESGLQAMVEIPAR